MDPIEERDVEKIVSLLDVPAVQEKLLLVLAQKGITKTVIIGGS